MPNNESELRYFPFFVERDITFADPTSSKFSTLQEAEDALREMVIGAWKPDHLIIREASQERFRDGEPKGLIYHYYSLDAAGYLHKDRELHLAHWSVCYLWGLAILAAVVLPLAVIAFFCS